VLGTLLKGTLNFSPATTVLEAVVWVAYVVPTMTLFLLRTRTPKPTAPTRSAAQPAKIS
jgi:high-affinity iron transporter